MFLSGVGIFSRWSATYQAKKREKMATAPAAHFHSNATEKRNHFFNNNFLKYIFIISFLLFFLLFLSLFF